MALVKKVLWGIFVGLAGLFSGVMVERGLKSVYNPAEDKKTDDTDGTGETTEETTETNCKPSISESEVEKGEEAEEEKSNEE